MDAQEADHFGLKPFTPAEYQRAAQILSTPLCQDQLAKRQGPGGTSLTYVESHRAIELANHIFSFNGWSCTVQSLDVDFMENSSGRWHVGATCIVRVTLKDGAFHEDVGFGIAANVRSRGEALEKAKKEAVSDARKRALRVFGEHLGNCIYNKGYVKSLAKRRGPSTVGAVELSPQQATSSHTRSSPAPTTAPVPVTAPAPSAPAPTIERFPYPPRVGPGAVGLASPQPTRSAPTSTLLSSPCVASVSVAVDPRQPQLDQERKRQLRLQRQQELRQQFQQQRQHHLNQNHSSSTTSPAREQQQKQAHATTVVPQAVVPSPPAGQARSIPPPTNSNPQHPPSVALAAVHPNAPHRPAQHPVQQGEKPELAGYDFDTGLSDDLLAGLPMDVVSPTKPKDVQIPLQSHNQQVNQHAQNSEFNHDPPAGREDAQPPAKRQRTPQRSRPRRTPTRSSSRVIRTRSRC